MLHDCPYALKLIKHGCEDNHVMTIQRVVLHPRDFNNKDGYHSQDGQSDEQL